MQKTIYVASPYSSGMPFDNMTDVEKFNLMKYRVKMTATSMGYLINKNRDVFFYSPICHFSTIADECNLPHDKDFWWDVNEHMLNISDEMYILNIPGWELSKGIHQETDHCKENNIPVYLIEWNTGNIIIEL